MVCNRNSPRIINYVGVVSRPTACLCLKKHAVSVCIAIAIHIDSTCIFNNVLKEDAGRVCAAYPTSSSEPTSWR